MADIWQLTLGWQPTDEQQRLFQKFYEGILDGNQRLNLTRITEPIDFWEKHLWDSVRGVWPQEPEVFGVTPTSSIKDLEGSSEMPPQSLKLIDIGTGAGFPGIPVAIAFPHHCITLLDSTRKKITFLDALITPLGIKNATTLIGRAEALTHQFQHRRTYDIALLRAVAPASVCAEYALPLLKTGGLAILYRGHWTDKETESLKPILEKSGGVIESIEGFTTPISKSVRHCVYLRSCAPLKELPLKKEQENKTI
jgi:16S rRNA (guanine527-N7)-methyltransferase